MIYLIFLQMMKAKSIIKSMRLRTLPLSLSGIVLGILLASDTFSIEPLKVVFLVLTTVLLQILSNLSNELGDAINGVDTKKRKGAHYSIMDGDMTVDQMRGLILIVVLACCVSGVLMIWQCLGNLMRPVSLLFVALGACAIAAAMRYTLGRKPYGYRGLGDIFVFIFFGLVTVCGAYYLLTESIPEASILLPASSIGCLSVAVLNVNNIRDMKTDAGKRRTTALRLGEKGARIYQTCLIAAAWILMAVFFILSKAKPAAAIFVLTMPFFVFHLRGVWTKKGKELDPMLPLLVTGTFFFALLSGIAVTL